jgi:hypothetical protein
MADVTALGRAWRGGEPGPACDSPGIRRGSSPGASRGRGALFAGLPLAEAGPAVAPFAGVPAAAAPVAAAPVAAAPVAGVPFSWAAGEVVPSGGVPDGFAVPLFVRGCSSLGMAEQPGCWSPSCTGPLIPPGTFTVRDSRWYGKA